MKKILELNGLKYSTSSFDEYRRRAKVRIHCTDSIHSLDIYTTDTSKERVEDVLLDRKSEKVLSLRIEHLTTRESDDATSKMIDEWLNEDITD